MGFKTTKNTSNKPLFFMTPTDKDKNGEKGDPYFKVTKLENGVKEECENQNGITATLNGVEVKSKSFTPQGKQPVPYDEISVRMSDDEANYVLSLRFRMDTRSLFNGLLNAKIGDVISIEIYKSKKGFLSYSLKNGNDERIDWKYSKEDLPPGDPVLIKGKVHYPHDAFFKDALIEAFGKSEQEDATESPASNEKEGDSIPF